MNDVSIIITNCNVSHLLPRAIRSALLQIPECLDVVVIDDKSTDNVERWIEPFIDDITFIRNPKNVGVAESANIGFRAARGQFVVRLDADDFIQQDMCFFLRTFLAHNLDYFGVSCDYWVVGTDETKSVRKCALEEPIACAIMYRRDILLGWGGYERERRHREEEELRKRMGDFYKIGHIHIPFYRYYMHDFNKTKEPEYQDAKA